MPVNNRNIPYLIVVTGPTAIGKSAVSLEIAQHFNTEIISADSRQLYREMKIGTAVPEPQELQLVPHHFVHTRSIHEYYNASRFESEVLNKLEELYLVHRVVVMAGGSMLYVDAVCNGIDDLPEVDPEIRRMLISEFEQNGIESLRIRLKMLDPAYYAEVDLKNHKRLLHALEICLMTGKPYSGFRKNQVKKRPFRIIKTGLTASRDIIYDRINRRVDQMVLEGLEEEARSLYPFRDNNALNTVGYREWFDAFDGKIPPGEVVEKIKSNTRRYARKQLTWFKRDQAVKWFDIGYKEEIIPWLEEQMQNEWNNTENW